MKYPDKIYLQTGTDEYKDFKELTDVTWSVDKIDGNDLEYFSKDYVENQINTAINSYKKSKNKIISEEIITTLKILRHFMFEEDGNYNKIRNNE